MATRPEKREQLNIRISPAGKRRLVELQASMAEALGIPGLSHTDIVEAALAELQRRYPPGAGKGDVHPCRSGADGALTDPPAERPAS